VTLAWDSTVVEPVIATTAGELESQGGVAFSPGPGALDLALMGVRGVGLSGELGQVSFRAIAKGDPRIRIGVVKARDATNRRVTLLVREPAPAIGIPARTSLAAAAPNPFQQTTTIEFGLSQSGRVDLSIYTVDGRRIRTLVSGLHEAGIFRIPWDGRDDRGVALRPGVYYARLVTNQGTYARTVVYLR